MRNLKLWQCVCGGSILWLMLASIGAAQTLAAPQTFERVKVLMLQNGKTREIAARLRFTGAEVVIEDLSGKVLLTAANDEVKAAGYFYSKHRRWQPFVASALAAIAVLPLAFLVESDALALIGAAGYASCPFTFFLAFTHSKRHWLTLRTKKETVTLRLDKHHYRFVLATLESQTNLTVSWQGER